MAKVKRLAWEGTLPRFSSMREGGPGRPWALLTLALIGGGLIALGTRRLEEGAPDAGAFIFLGAFLLLFLAFWLLVKAILRPLEATFVLHHRGIEIVPSPRQRALDRRTRALVQLAFLLTFKGGQWADWTPHTRWKDVRKVIINEQRREICIRGGPWDLRLPCAPDNFERACEILQKHVPARAQVIRREGP